MILVTESDKTKKLTVELSNGQCIEGVVTVVGVDDFVLEWRTGRDVYLAKVKQEAVVAVIYTMKYDPLYDEGKTEVVQIGDKTKGRNTGWVKA